MNKAESKPHAEENNYYDNFLDSSSYNSVSYPLQILHDSRIFLVLNASYTNKRTRERDRRTVRQTDRQTDRQTETQTETEIPQQHYLKTKQSSNPLLGHYVVATRYGKVVVC